MISTELLLIKLDNKLNKNSNLEHQKIHLENKILALNEAQIKLIKNKIGLSNEYRLGLDGFNKRYQDLQILVVPYTKLSITDVGDILHSYSANINSLNQKLFIPLDMYVLSDMKGCEGRKLKVIEVVKHPDLQLKLDSPHTTPSFEYQETVATISDDKIYTYSDGDFDITSLYITYLRYPKYIDYPGYVKLDNTASALVNCELPDYLEDELINLTVQDLALATENQGALQGAILSKKESE